jgi:hypothetical protein
MFNALKTSITWSHSHVCGCIACRFFTSEILTSLWGADEYFRRLPSVFLEQGLIRYALYCCRRVLSSVAECYRVLTLPRVTECCRVLPSVWVGFVWRHLPILDQAPTICYAMGCIAGGYEHRTYAMAMHVNVTSVTTHRQLIFYKTHITYVILACIIKKHNMIGIKSIVCSTIMWLLLLTTYREPVLLMRIAKCEFP